MIITRTPFRISFFGGGTDLPCWYQENGGAVLSTTIDKYCYISCRHLPPFFKHKHRIVYSKTELVNTIDEILHPAVREIFRYMNVDTGIELHHDGDLPARAGLGSSSSFTVGLLQALYCLEGKIVTKEKLAKEAIFIEQHMINECVGSQDQVAAAYGGFNKITFNGENNIKIIPITISKERKNELQEHLVLLFTGFTRYSSKIEQDKINQFSEKNTDLKTLCDMVDDAIVILSEGDIEDFGKLLHETWKLKKSLSDKVSTEVIDEIYSTALKNGATGGKLLGAGGGGFILFFVKPDNRQKLIESLSPLLVVPFGFDYTGSQVIYFTEDGV